jgi:hypothetical protein
MDVSRDLRSERIRRENVSTSSAREKRGERRSEAVEIKLRRIFLDRLSIETILWPAPIAVQYHFEANVRDAPQVGALPRRAARSSQRLAPDRPVLPKFNRMY